MHRQRKLRYGLPRVSPPIVFEGLAKAISVDETTGDPVAIKVIDLETSTDELDDINQEVLCLSRLQSPYIVRYHGSFLKNVKELWIVMEYCENGSIQDMVSLDVFGWRKH